LQGHDSSTLWHANHFGDDSDADTHWYGDIRESVRVFDEAAAHISTMARQTPRPPALRPDEFLYLYAHGKALSDHELATLRGQNQRQLDEMASLLGHNQQQLDEMASLLGHNQQQLDEISVLKASNADLLVQNQRQLDEMSNLLGHNQQQLDEISILKASNAELFHELEAMRATRSWKITKPLRQIRSLLQRCPPP
jgi:hypothetical protein